MLTKKENVILTIISEKCSNSKCLISEFLLNESAFKLGVSQVEIGKILHSLEINDYIDVINTDRHGEPFLYVNLHKKGENYMRERAENKKNFMIRMLLATLSAFVTFIVGRILFFIFK